MPRRKTSHHADVVVEDISDSDLPAAASDEGKRVKTGKKHDVQPTIINVPADHPCFAISGQEIAETEIDSAVRGRQFFEWLIAPVTSEEFFRDYFEKKPLIIKRNRADYYKGWYSKADIEKLLREQQVKTGRDLDITNYVNGERKTYEYDGRVDPAVAWRKYEQERCSLRVLCPQEYCDSVSEMLALLEEHWGMCFSCSC